MARIEIERLQDCEDFGFTFAIFVMGHSASEK